jgi:hypothetical protein
VGNGPRASCRNASASGQKAGAEAKQHLAHRAHLQPVQRGRQARHGRPERDRSRRGRLGLEHADRQRDDGGARAHRRQRMSGRRAQAHAHRAARPLHRGGGGAEPHFGPLRVQARAQPLDELVIAALQAVLPLRLRLLRAFAQPARAGALEVGGRIAFDEEARHRAHLAGSAAAGQEVGEREVGAQAARGRQQASHVVPRVVHRAQPAACGPDVDVGQLDHARARRLRGPARVRRLAVQELGAQLRRQGPGAVVQREHTAAQPRPCFDDHDAAPGLGQGARGRQPGHAGAQHHDVGAPHAPAARRRRRIQRPSAGRP